MGQWLNIYSRDTTNASTCGNSNVSKTTGQTEMSAKRALMHYYPKLVDILPMNDAIFIAELVPHGLLPSDLKDQVQACKTSKDKATHFLDNVIKPSVNSGVGSSFDKLLNVMESSDYQGVRELAKLIRDSMGEETTNNG